MCRTTSTNYVIGRKHQLLLNVARALYFQSRVPLLINRTPSSFLGNKTPYELLCHSSVDYASLRVFWSLAFASTLPSHRTKLYPKSRMCVFLGDPSGVKEYRLYDIVSKHIFLSRDVIFHEDIFHLLLYILQIK